ncbi:hypothetical protein B0H34DRAFT_801361 [Crassisporium funariophilum]|nr:hypothetical protein B0H34DRAFT_801361 [Crassisporium funariophilum]
MRDILNISARRTRRASSALILQPSRAIPLATVPDEVLEQILQFCTRASLLRLTQTCHRLSLLATKAIYRHVRPTTTPQIVGFLVAVCFYPHTRPLVRRLELDIKHAPAPAHEVSLSLYEPFHRTDVVRWALKLGTRRVLAHRYVLRDFQSLLAAALGHMGNLTHLELLFPEGSGAVPRDDEDVVTRRLLGQCTFQLTRLNTTLRFGSALAAFLQKQHSLRELQICTAAPLASLDVTDPKFLQKGTLSSLVCLSWTSRVPVEIVRHLMRGREVYKINIAFYVGVGDIAPLLDIGAGWENIRIANFTFRDSRQPTYAQLEAICARFPNVVGLGIAIVTLTEDFGVNLAKVLSRYPHLKCLLIYDQTHETDAYKKAVQYSRRWFKECATLTRIRLYVCDSPIKLGKKVRRSATFYDDLLRLT